MSALPKPAELLKKPASRPGPLSVRESEGGSEKQYTIESNYLQQGDWDDIYVSFAGFYGSYGPHVFAAAPDLLAVLKRIDNVMDFSGTTYPQFDGLQDQMLAAIAKAEGRS